MPDLELPTTAGARVNFATAGARDRLLLSLDRPAGPAQSAGLGRHPRRARLHARRRRASAISTPASAQLGATVFGLSTQPTAYQQELVERLDCRSSWSAMRDFALPTRAGAADLRDRRRDLSQAPDAGLNDGRIERVYYPIAAGRARARGLRLARHDPPLAVMRDTRGRTMDAPPSKPCRLRSRPLSRGARRGGDHAPCRGPMGDGVTCSVDTGKALVEAGLHPATGGTPAICSGDMLLQALVACAGVTLNAVATSLGLAIRDARSAPKATLTSAARSASPRRRRSASATSASPSTSTATLPRSSAPR